MAKLILQRFPDPRPEYDAQQSAELIRQLEEMIQPLKSIPLKVWIMMVFKILLT